MTDPVVPNKPVLVTVAAPPSPSPAVSIEALIAPHVIESPIIARVVRVDQELAKALLAFNLDGNRRTPASATARLARVIGTDKWRVNGESLKFAIDNVMPDGQTRLKACIESGRSFDTVVLLNLPVDIYDSLDQGRKRKVEDALTRHGVTHARVMAAAVIAIDALKARSAPVSGSRWVGTDADEALSFINDNPRLSASVIATAPAVKLAPHSLLAALHFHFAGLDPAMADTFFADLASGANLKDKDPVYVLREKLIDDTRTRAKNREAPNRWHTLAWIILAWNARRLRKSMTKFPATVLVRNDEGHPRLPEAR